MAVDVIMESSLCSVTYLLIPANKVQESSKGWEYGGKSDPYYFIRRVFLTGKDEKGHCGTENVEIEIIASRIGCPEHEIDHDAKFQGKKEE